MEISQNDSDARLKTQSDQQNPHATYRLNQHTYQNIRLGQMLTPAKSNPKLQKYLEDKSVNYDTASFGETTSADELYVKSPGEDSSVEIFRQSEVARQYDKAKQAALDIETYEQVIIEKYLSKDIYRQKNLSYKEISFNDFTLSENVNYIKYNLKHSHDAFAFFQITQEKFQGPEIAASLLQKLATKSNLTDKDFATKIFKRFEYKKILQRIESTCGQMGTKWLIDTVFSLGKLHKSQDQEALDEYGDFKFF